MVAAKGVVQVAELAAELVARKYAKGVPASSPGLSPQAATLGSRRAGCRHNPEGVEAPWGGG